MRRLDRLVSDISNASRLDSELVKEEEEEFNLLDQSFQKKILSQSYLQTTAPVISYSNDLCLIKYAFQLENGTRI